MFKIQTEAELVEGEKWKLPSLVPSEPLAAPGADAMNVDNENHSGNDKKGKTSNVKSSPGEHKRKRESQ